MINNPNTMRNLRTIQGPFSGVIMDSDDILNIDTTNGSVNLYLQNIKTSGLLLGQRLININDVGNQASVNNIVVYGSNGDLVNNANSVVISTDGANVECTIANHNEWAILGFGAEAPPVSDKNYVHEQKTNESIWIVPHNLGKKCSVQVVGNDGTEIEADVVWNSNNEVTITFNTPRSGAVYCN